MDRFTGCRSQTMAVGSLAFSPDGTKLAFQRAGASDSTQTAGSRLWITSVAGGKPIAVDGPGVRRFMAANELAKKKDLLVAIGLQRRHDPRYIETMKKVHDGALGDILFTRVYWNSGPLWVRTHADFLAEMTRGQQDWEIIEIRPWDE